MPRLSAVLITRDEEKDIGRTIQALSFADEVLVVDSGSTDRTVEICRHLGARVLHHDFEGYGAQKRWSVEQASHDWVLHLDADEVVTPELGRAIRTLLDAGEPPLAAYRICFPTVFLGSVMRHGPLKARWKLRLFDRRRASWSGSAVHEMVETDGAVGDLEGDAYHHTARDVSDSLGKLDAYTTLSARELARRGKRRSALALVVAFHYQFFRHWVLQRNFRNGIPGLVWSILDSLGSLIKHAKAWQLREQVAASSEPAPRRAQPAGARVAEPPRSPPTASPGGIRIEYPWQAKAAAWLALAVGIAGVAGILPETDDPGEWSAVAALLLFGAAVLWFLVAAYGRRLTLFEGGIEARWWGRRRFVPWSDITSVDVIGKRGLILSCRVGEALAVSGRMTGGEALARELLVRRIPLAGETAQRTVVGLSAMEALGA